MLARQGDGHRLRGVAVRTRLPPPCLGMALGAPGQTPSASRATAPSGMETPRVSVQEALALLWLAGALLWAIPIGVAMSRLARLRYVALPWPHGQRFIDNLKHERGIHRVVTVLHTRSADGFFSFGWLRPVVLVPSDAGSWPTEALRRALVHELEHVRRCDWATLLFSRVVCALYWFHPLVWVVSRRLSLYAEQACDDAVVADDDAVEYASLLLELAERSSIARHPLLAIATPGDLSSRIHAVSIAPGPGHVSADGRWRGRWPCQPSLPSLSRLAWC